MRTSFPCTFSYSLSRQYAYRGADTSRARAPQLTDEQKPASLRQPRSLDIHHGMMAPPPPPSHGKRFKPATGQAHSQTNQVMEASTSHNHGSQRMPNSSENMGPPQRPFSAVLRTPARVPMQNTTSTLLTSRFIPAGTSYGRAISGPTLTPVGHAGRASGGTRMPFMPQSSSGFG